MNNEAKYLSIAKHYEQCLRRFGDCYLGVDWPKAGDVDKRYQVMMDIIGFRKLNDRWVTLLDFGCGLSHLYEFISRKEIGNVEYSGLDISKEFVDLSRKKFPNVRYYCADLIQDKNAIPDFNFIVMNGIFTEKRDLTFDEMFEFFTKLLTNVFCKADKGVAFNVMSKAVAWERDDLFHLPTDLLVDFLTKDLSRNFVIRNDYGLYEYTVYVYK